MPKNLNKNENLPLPYNWEVSQDYDGKTYYIDHTRKITTWIDPRDRYTKPETFADCIGNELPIGWEENYDPQIGIFYINHNNQCTQLEDPRLEWKSMQEEMLREYVTSAEDQLEAQKEIYDIKQQRLLLAQDEYNHLNALAASRTSLCSSASSCSTKFDPDLLRADLVLAKERVYRLRKEMARIQTEMSYTQRGVETLHGVEQKLSNHENGCYNITEAQAIMEEVKNIQKSLLLGEKEKKELMHSLAQVKEDLTRLQLRQESPDASTFNLANDRISAASQTDMCADSFPIGAREMKQLRMKYDEWRKKVKDIQEKLAALEERIRPGELESDQDRLLLFQEKKQLLLEYRSISPRSRSEEEMVKIKQLCKKLESDLNNAYEESNQCIASRLKLHEEKQMLLQELLDALREVTHLENQLKSVSASTLSISSGSSMGSLSTASSKGSLSGISFTDIYGDPLAAEPRVDMVDISRKIQRFFPPATSEVSLSSRSSLSTETPPASPMKIEPMYENAAALFDGPSTSGQHILDCVCLDEHLQELKIKQAPLSPIYEKPSLLDIPQSALSRSSSASNTHSVSVSAAVSDESVAGDSGVFEASRVSTQIKESAQIQVTLKYLIDECALHITIERARNLNVLGLPAGCQLYIKAALLPVSSTGNPVILRTKTFNDFIKPIFGASIQVPISLNKVYTKSLQIKIMVLLSQREDWVGSAQVSLAEFNTHQEGNSKWYNIISRQNITETDVDDNLLATREESSDESTVISSQTSTLTRNQGQDEMQQQAVLAMSLQEQLIISDDEESDEEGEDEACGRIDEVYDDVSTAQMLETYINEVQNYDVLNVETVDAQTNTEFLPEYQQQRNAMMRLRDRVGSASATSLRDPTIYPIEDRSSLVKRSQTFSPSAVTVCSKSRYICRRSDSDSAMHFNMTAVVAAQQQQHQQQQPHPFRRGAVERRSLRYHSKVTRSISTKINPGVPPRTSLDLELDLKAQQSRLETLNDEITRLRELKQRLEQARDANDVPIANWALENEEFKNLVETYNSTNCIEDKRMQKLLRKTSKEIYKLRKTKIEKNKPDMISFKEKMAFFTRRGASSVPEIPPPVSTVTATTNNKEVTEEDTKKLHYVLDRDGVEV